MRVRSAAVTLFVIACCVAPIVAQQEQATITYESTEVVPGLWMLEGKGGFAGGNIGLLDGEDGAVLIDDGLPPLTDTLLEAIAKLTKRKVEFVVNTHVHGDHIGGNAVLAERGATIVAHDRLRARMADEDDTDPDALPVVTFSDAVTFHLNGHTARVFHVARAHTDGDAVIHFEDANVIHTGDVLFNRIFPFIDLNSGGTVEGYIAAQKAILALCDETTKVIPGHGPLGNAADLRASIAMLESGLASVRRLVAEGKTIDEAVEANPLGEFAADWDWGFINAERMTRTIYRDVAGD